MADSQRKTANLFDISFNRDTSHSTTVYKWTLSGLTPNTSYTCSTNFVQEGSSASIWFSGVESLNNGVSANNPKTKTSNSSGEIPIYIKHGSSTAAYELIDSGDVWLMVNEGSTPLPYEPYGWLHSLRKLTTATETITTLPADVYADGNSATVGLVGNMQQTGTPTPQNPIQPQETGERTGNLFDKYAEYTVGQTSYQYTITGLTPNQYYTCSTNFVSQGLNKEAAIYFNGGNTANNGVDVNTPKSFRCGNTGTMTILVRFQATSQSNPPIYDDLINGTIWIMLNEGTTPLPYQPYGYKLDIKSANTTTPVYLGEVQTTRKIGKLKLLSSLGWNRASNGAFYTSGITDYLFEQKNIVRCSHFVSQINTTGTSSVNDDKVAFYFNNTQQQAREFYVAYRSITSLDEFKAFLNNNDVYIWYVLATPTTGIVNEPIRKIGDYADTVSGITIPTITGKDTVDVETSLKPSEVSLTYTGWHDATVKEWDGSEWQ